jgi:hypothetical protein
MQSPRISIRPIARVFGLLVLTASAVDAAPPSVPAVPRDRVPDGGIQPQVATGADGTVHLVYFRGEAANGDLYYCRRAPDEEQFSEPVRVNSTPGSAIAAGTIRGAQVALGRGGRLHVVWNGSNRAEPRGPKKETPLLYTRLVSDGARFEPERNVITSAYGLDGGATLGADVQGNVYIAWHAGTGRGEESRRVWMVRSADDGTTFDAERAIDVPRVGACGCCGMRGTVAQGGAVMFLYRSARPATQRDIYLLTSLDAGESFTSRKLQAWEIGTCPMSSEAFAHQGDRSWAAWETDEQVFMARVDADTGQASTPRAAPGRAARRKHPALAVNARGELLMVWTEGTGWNKGGGLAWQQYDPEGRPTDVKGREPGIPVWSFATPYARPDGSFAILY